MADRLSVRPEIWEGRSSWAIVDETGKAVARGFETRMEAILAALVIEEELGGFLVSDPKDLPTINNVTLEGLAEEREQNRREAHNT